MLEAQRCFLSSVEWAWDTNVQRIDKDTAASGKLVAQRDVMTGKILQGEWRLEANIKAAWVHVIEVVNSAWEKTTFPWERGENEDDEKDSEEETAAEKEEPIDIEQLNEQSRDTDEVADGDTTGEKEDPEDEDDDEEETDTEEEEQEEGGWTEHLHPGTCRSYYVNATTKETTWTKPPELQQRRQ